MTNHRVGGEVDGYCTKCRMLLAHTIVAMVEERIVRVRCNTCMGQHMYRPGPPGSARAKTRSAAKTPATRRKSSETSSSGAQTVEAYLAAHPELERRPYSPKERFDEGEVILHPTFGVGLVQQARHDKIDVVFHTSEKTLIHGKA